MAEAPTLPIPISYIHDRYLLFDTHAATYLRREHNTTGVLTGSLPQIPQQNVFLGLPVELMPEEAKLLTDKGVAYIVDDVRRFEDPSKIEDGDRQLYLQDLKRRGREVARIKANEKEQKREQALSKVNLEPSTKPPPVNTHGASEDKDDGDGNLFEGPSSPRPSTTRTAMEVQNVSVTPASSDALIPPEQCLSHNINIPKSYPLFAELHSKGYFLSPGLRFGCQYMAYPGDPLRFHSHFLVVGYDWEEEFDLMELVGGGRLGTGVKKGFLIGGEDKGSYADLDSLGRISTWTLEWAGM